MSLCRHGRPVGRCEACEWLIDRAALERDDPPEERWQEGQDRYERLLDVGGGSRCGCLHVCECGGSS